MVAWSKVGAKLGMQWSSLKDALAVCSLGLMGCQSPVRVGYKAIRLDRKRRTSALFLSVTQEWQFGMKGFHQKLGFPLKWGSLSVCVFTLGFPLKWVPLF